MDSLPLGGLIKHLRKMQDISQRELARRAGVTQGSLSKLESGKSKPLFETVFRVSMALGIQLNTLGGSSGRT